MIQPLDIVALTKGVNPVSCRGTADIQLSNHAYRSRFEVASDFDGSIFGTIIDDVISFRSQACAIAERSVSGIQRSAL